MSKRVRGTHAYGFCDRTGFRYPIEDLVEEYVQGKRTGLRVGRDMWDEDHPQNWLGKLDNYEDPQKLDNPRPDLSQKESRARFSFDPVGLGGLLMQAKVGSVTVT